MTNALDHYFSALARDAAAAAGSPLDGGTLVAPVPDRSGSGSATSCPTPSGTIVWCDPDVADAITDVLHPVRSRTVDSHEFVDLATAHGATLSGFGNNRVLVGQVVAPDVSFPGLEVRRLDRDDPTDRELLGALASGVTADDRDEAEFDPEHLDPFIVGVLLDDRVVAYASSVPAEVDDRFDDIAVITHAEHRRRGFGALAVSEFVRLRQMDDPECLMLYRCNATNAGSNAVAESLGFTLAHMIGAVRFVR